MGKLTRRGTLAAAVASAAALALSPAAFAQADGGVEVDEDDLVSVVEDGDARVWRVADEDRIGTSVRAAESVTIGDGWGDTVIIANNQEFADALAAGPLADILDAPILIDRPGNAPSGQIQGYLDRNSGTIENVILASGTAVFSNAYANSLNDDFDVERYAGANRYQTAAALAGAALAAGDEYGEFPGGFNIFLASGTDFPDALAAGAAAAASSGVVLLTVGDSHIDTVTGAAISLGQFPLQTDEFIHTSLIAAGGPAVDATEAGWNGNPVETDFEHVGANRYETAVMLAEGYVGGAENAVIASGEGFADAIVGGGLAANVDGPLLLAQNNNLPNVVSDYFEDTRTDWENIIVLGGLNSITKTVTDQLVHDVEWTY